MKNVVVMALLLIFSAAFAHSAVVKIVPASGSSVTAPKTVKITFNYGIEGKFSTFKVYPYAGTVSNGALRAFVKEKIVLKNDAAARVDSGHNAQGTTKNVTITLKPQLKTGVYVVMWRILGEDTHTLDGWSFFRVK